MCCEATSLSKHKHKLHIRGTRHSQIKTTSWEPCIISCRNPEHLTIIIKLISFNDFYGYFKRQVCWLLLHPEITSWSNRFRIHQSLHQIHIIWFGQMESKTTINLQPSLEYIQIQIPSKCSLVRLIFGCMEFDSILSGNLESAEQTRPKGHWEEGGGHRCRPSFRVNGSIHTN